MREDRGEREERERREEKERGEKKGRRDKKNAMWTREEERIRGRPKRRVEKKEEEEERRKKRGGGGGGGGGREERGEKKKKRRRDEKRILKSRERKWEEMGRDQKRREVSTFTLLHRVFRSYLFYTLDILDLMEPVHKNQ